MKTITVFNPETWGYAEVQVTNVVASLGEKLARMSACSTAVRWLIKLNPKSAQQAWDACEEPGWLAFALEQSAPKEDREEMAQKVRDSLGRIRAKYLGSVVYSEEIGHDQWDEVPRRTRIRLCNKIRAKFPKPPRIK